jgi:ribokinase
MPATRARALVLGDLVLDVVLAPAGPLRRGTDVAGRVSFRQGGSAATTARWLARLGTEVALVTAVGDDGLGEALVAHLESLGVTVHALRIRGARTGRLGVLVEEDGERSFVADRGAIQRLSPRSLDPRWFGGLDLLHLPAYSLVGDTLAAAASRAARLARQGGAAVSIDLASAGFLAAEGPARILGRVAEIGPDVLLATHAEAEAAVQGDRPAGLLRLAPLVVVKEGAHGAAVYVRGVPEPLGVPTLPAGARDTTGAGDAFDAGFLAAWIQLSRGTEALGAARPARPGHQRPAPTTVREGDLRRAVVAGHRAAGRELLGRRTEFDVAGLLVHGAAPPVHRAGG